MSVAKFICPECGATCGVAATRGAPITGTLKTFCPRCGDHVEMAAEQVRTLHVVEDGDAA